MTLTPDAGVPPPPRQTTVPRAGQRRQSGRPRFDADPGDLFWTAIKGVLLTIFTLGIYRFWMVTRLRRLYWSALRVAGDPLEYTGTGLEKLLGFLLALVVLALYLGAVNLGLAFVGLSYFSQDQAVQAAVLNVSILATLPLIYYATYRGQRYVLARTRWRGIRFGLQPGAWGYTWRAMLLTLLTLLTAGLAYPYQHFTLAKYITDRAWYGDLAFHQGGTWKKLFAHWIGMYVVSVIAALLVFNPFFFGYLAGLPDEAAVLTGTLVALLLLIVTMLLYQRYRVAAFRVLWSYRILGRAVFKNDLRAGKVIGIYIGGGLLTSVCAGIATVLIGLTLGFAMMAAGIEIDILPGLGTASGRPPTLAESWPVLLLLAATYLTLFGAGYAFGQVFITRPVLRAQVEAMAIAGAEHLSQSKQRPHDHAAEAGGFADALGVDIGAGL